jgi:hypothetical protein
MSKCVRGSGIAVALFSFGLGVAATYSWMKARPVWLAPEVRMGIIGFFRSLFGGPGATAKHAAWDDPVDIAALTLPEIVTGHKPVLVVVHDLGLGDGLGGWLFLDGQDLAARKPTGIAKVDLLTMDPTLAEVTDLPVGWQASRDGPGKPWNRHQL